MNEYLLVAAVNEYVSHSEIGFLRRPDPSGEWEGSLGLADLSKIVLNEECLSFESHVTGKVPIKRTFNKADENIYRKARFETMSCGTGSGRTFQWVRENGNATILLVPVADGFIQKFFRDLSKPQESPSSEDQVADVAW
jgi:hypothetical protein